jgi:hypothetical protein
VNIAGQVAMSGSHYGMLPFKNLAKPLHLDSRNTDLRVAQAPGTNGPGDLAVYGFTQSLEIETDRGDIDLKAGKAPLARFGPKSRSDNIELVPESASSILKATTKGQSRRGTGDCVADGDGFGEEECRASSTGCTDRTHHLCSFVLRSWMHQKHHVASVLCCALISQTGSHLFGLLGREQQMTRLCSLQRVFLNGLHHDPARGVLTLAKNHVAQFMGDGVPKNHGK